MSLAEGIALIPELQEQALAKKINIPKPEIKPMNFAGALQATKTGDGKYDMVSAS